MCSGRASSSARDKSTKPPRPTSPCWSTSSAPLRQSEETKRRSRWTRPRASISRISCRASSSTGNPGDRLSPANHEHGSSVRHLERQRLAAAAVPDLPDPLAESVPDFDLTVLERANLVLDLREIADHDPGQLAGIDHFASALVDGIGG